MPKFAAFLCFILFSLNLQAQTWELGIAAGGAGYMGDLNANNPLKISGGSVGAYIKRNFDGYLSAKLNYTFGTISAADSNSSNQQFRNRNLGFTTSLHEFSLIGEFNFMKYIPEAGHNIFTPYIYLGIASLKFNPQTGYGDQTYNLRPYKTEGEKKQYSNSAFSIPYGAGIKLNIYGKFTLSADIGYRNPNTDYLDDVSGVYAKKAQLQSGLSQILSDRSGEKTGVYIGSPGSQRGDLNPRDTYFFTQISIAFTFVTRRCYFE